MPDRSVYGTAKLRSKLGELQLDIIRGSIPGIMKEVNEKQEMAKKELDMLGENLPTIVEKRLFFNRQIAIFKNNLEASLTGIGGNNRSETDSPASAKLHCYAKEFREKLQKGKLININTIEVGSNVLVAVKNSGEIRGEVKHLDDNFACVEFVEKEDSDNVTMFKDGYCDYFLNNAPRNSVTGEVLNFGEEYAIIRKVLEDGARIGDYFENIPFGNIRTDPSWLKIEIEENRTQDLACFLNIDEFNSVIRKFIKDDWEPRCYEFLGKAVKLLEDTATAALLVTRLGSQYQKLCSLIEISIADLIKDANESAKKEIAEHLTMEMYPYTQDHYLFENISRNRNKRLKEELERCLLLTNKQSMTHDAIRAILEGTFNRNQGLSIDNHMAEEMGVMLEAYGKVCFKRVTDKTPMLCQKIFRSISQNIADGLQGITDAELDMVMQKEPGVTRRYEEAKATVHEMDKAIIIFRELQTSLVGSR
jgi:hypothetical protein